MIDSGLNVDKPQENQGESGEDIVMENGSAQSISLPEMNPSFAYHDFEFGHVDCLLQAFPRQPGWRTLTPRQEQMRKKLYVDIFKTPDQNLEILLEKLVLKKYINRAEMTSLKKVYRLAVFLFKECVYDLCDFEDKDPQPGKPKIVLDSVINDISAIVLVKLKLKPGNSMRSKSQDLIMQDSIEIEENKIVETESETFSDSDIEEGKRQTRVESEVVQHRKQAKKAKKTKTEQSSDDMDHLSPEDQLIREKVETVLDKQCRFIAGLKETQ